MYMYVYVCMYIYNAAAGIAQRYSNSLSGGRSGDRIPVEGTFSMPVQTGPGAHPDSYTMGAGFFQGG
jgi:hypothetical protein